MNKLLEKIALTVINEHNLIYIILNWTQKDSGYFETNNYDIPKLIRSYYIVLHHKRVKDLKLRLF
jgi:hypothetical protein